MSGLDRAKIRRIFQIISKDDTQENISDYVYRVADVVCLAADQDDKELFSKLLPYCSFLCKKYRLERVLSN
jgi:hypothetical protein